MGSPFGRASLDAQPRLVAIERPEVAAHLELPAVVERTQADAIDLAVVRVEDVAALERRLVVGARLDVADDRHADDRLVLALVAAILADRVLGRVRIDDLLVP